ncbi:MAG: cytochrome c [Novosphingobium sp.]
MPKNSLLAALALLVAAGGAQLCAGSAAARSRTGLSASASRGLAFAQQRCSACHGVVANRSSPNPESPPFEDIANRPGVTQATLRQFLRDSHNYPLAMNFEVENARIRDLAAYIVTLKKPGYRPLVN